MTIKKIKKKLKKKRMKLKKRENWKKIKGLNKKRDSLFTLIVSFILLVVV